MSFLSGIPKTLPVSETGYEFLQEVAFGLLKELAGEVKIPPHVHFHFSFMRDPRAFSTKATVSLEISVRGREVTTACSDFSLTDAEIHDDRSSWFIDRFYQAVMTLRPYLYAHDPRRGWQPRPFQLYEDLKWPASQLFDPPHIPLPWEDSHDDSIPNICIVCNNPVRESSTWGGGALLWLHEECWRKT